jgi:DHA2 family multidrug resistance protein-like MFS transporter
MNTVHAGTGLPVAEEDSNNAARKPIDGLAQP